jgi:hypothetical protein
MVVSYSVVTLVFITFDRSDLGLCFALICECPACMAWCKYGGIELLTGLVVSCAAQIWPETVG